MSRIILLVIALTLPPTLGWAEQKSDLQQALESIEGVEIPLSATVEQFDCSRKWRSDPFCKLVWAAQIRLFDKDEYVGAVKLAVAALELKPRSRRALGIIGRALLDLNSCWAAVPYLEAAAHLDEAPYVLNDYIHCLPQVSADRRDSERALRLTELAAHKTGNDWNWYAASRLHRQAGRYAAARNRADRIVEDHSDDPIAWRRYADVLADLDELEEAVAAMERAIELRNDVRGDETRPYAIEKYYMELVGVLQQAERYDEARKHVQNLLRAPQPWRDRAARKLAWIDYLQHGAERGLRTLNELDPEDADFTRAHLAHSVAISSEDAHVEFDEEKLGLSSRVSWLVATDDERQAQELVTRSVRRGSSDARDLVSTLDFRRGECSVLARARYTFIRSRSDGMDLWRDSLFSSAWKLICGKKPSTGLTPSRQDPPHRQELAMAMHKAAALFSVADYDDAYRAAAKLPAEGPPVFHVFGMWLAAGVRDERAFKRHASAASRGDLDGDEHLAHVFFHLRRGDLPAARKRWQALPPWLRDQPIIVDVPRALLAYRIVVEANELDPDFAVQMAEKWFWTSGPLERWIWNRLQRTGTQFAER